MQPQISDDIFCCDLSAGAGQKSQIKNYRGAAGARDKNPRLRFLWLPPVGGKNPGLKTIWSPLTRGTKIRD